MSSDDIQQRKADHLDLCATDEVAFKERTTLLEAVRLVHQSLPELSLDEIDMSVRLFGKTLRALKSSTPVTRRGVPSPSTNRRKPAPAPTLLKTLCVMTNASRPPGLRYLCAAA